VRAVAQETVAQNGPAEGCVRYQLNYIAHAISIEANFQPNCNVISRSVLSESDMSDPRRNMMDVIGKWISGASIFSVLVQKFLQILCGNPLNYHGFKILASRTAVPYSHSREVSTRRSWIRQWREEAIVSLGQEEAADGARISIRENQGRLCGT
jgi:hypothetical protein